VKLSKKQRERYQRLLPLDIAAYLRHHGWKKVNEKEEVFSVWIPEKEPENGTDLLLPLRPDFGDYALRIAEILENLADVEGREVAEILADLASPHHDVVLIEFNGSKISLEDGSALLGSVRDLMLAAACSAIRPHAVWQSSTPDEALRFLRRFEVSRFDASALEIKSPIAPEPEEPRSDRTERPAPYARRAIVTLMRSLAMLRRTVQRFAEHGSIGPIEILITTGVSADLCRALTDLCRNARASIVTFGVNWASGRSICAKDIERRIPFSIDMVPYIDGIEEEFSKKGAVLQRSWRSEGTVLPVGSAWGNVVGEETSSTVEAKRIYLPPEDLNPVH